MPEYTFKLYQTDAPFNLTGSSGQEIIAIYTITVSDDDALGIGDNDVGGGTASETGAAPVVVSGDPALPAGWNVGDSFYFGADRNLSDQTIEDALLYPRVADIWQSSYFALREGSDPYQVGDTLGTVTLGTNTPPSGEFGSSVEEVTPQFACFTRGTLIETDCGAHAIEELTQGRLVRTRDNGLQAIRWIGSRKIDAVGLAADHRLRPIRIAAGAMGAGTPERDLLVSRQHRVLVRSAIAKRMFDTDEVLIPAIKLTDLAGIEIEAQARCLEYFHILFDRHEIILSNGAWTESLYMGPQAQTAVPAASRAEVAALFPALLVPPVAPWVARLIPENGRQMKQLVARHHKNNKPLYLND